MQNDRVVLDTNSLLVSLSRRGSAYPVWKGFQEGLYTLCVTTEKAFPDFCHRSIIFRTVGYEICPQCQRCCKKRTRVGHQ